MKIWKCKIGELDESLVPHEADAPMREAVAEEYKALTGVAPTFIFSGWGAELTSGERAVVENRTPTEQEYQQSEEYLRARLEQAERERDEARALLREWVKEPSFPQKFATRLFKRTKDHLRGSGTEGDA